MLNVNLTLKWSDDLCDSDSSGDENTSKGSVDRGKYTTDEVHTIRCAGNCFIITQKVCGCYLAWNFVYYVLFSQNHQIVLSTPSGLLSASNHISKYPAMSTTPSRRVNVCADVLRAVIASTAVLGEEVVQGVIGLVLAAAKEVMMSFRQFVCVFSHFLASRLVGILLLLLCCVSQMTSRSKDV